MEIKTIAWPLDRAEAFDRDVNKAIAEGWTLTKREVLIPMAHPADGTSYRMLYAELEKGRTEQRENKLETPHTVDGCANCKHLKTRKNGFISPSSPCFLCSMGDKWELER